MRNNLKNTAKQMQFQDWVKGFVVGNDYGLTGWV